MSPQRSVLIRALHPVLVLVGSFVVAGFVALPRNAPGMLPPGAIVFFGGPMTKVPPGFLPCDGTERDRAAYSDLFNTIGTIYGGVAVDKFRLPNLVGRVPVGAATRNGVNPLLAQTFGSATIDLPAHTHAVSAHHHTWLFGGGGADLSSGGTYHSAVRASTGQLVGASDPHVSAPLITSDDAATATGGGAARLDNAQPSIALTCLIKT